MLQQPLPALAFPPTPEAEASMADLRPSADQSFSTQAVPPEPSQISIIDTPTSPSSSFALSRFEFEPGRGNEGTKVLLVEWDSSATSTKTAVTASASGSARGHVRQKPEAANEQRWAVTWEGKASYNVLAADDAASERDSTMKRVYFLLPPGAHIPPLVNIARSDVNSGSGGEDVVLWTKPMPAIYPASLSPGGSGNESGRRGVLHTLWAKQRLHDLAAEIEAEMKANSESIGLQIAIQEQDWISEHFGVGEPSRLREIPPYLPSPESPTARPAKPRSPIGGKLGEKLKGLKLATSPAELAAASQVRKATAYSTHSAHTSGAPRPAVFTTRVAPHTSIEPPAGVHHSLDAVIQGAHVANGTAAHSETVDGDGEDELFALPLSPRSPEMAMSPFSLL